MRRAVVCLVMLLCPATVRADESDDATARKLGGMVRDFRLTTLARAEAARTLAKLGPRASAAVPDLLAVFDRLRGREQELLQEAIVEALGQIGTASRPALTSFAKGAGRTIDVDLAIKKATELILNAPESQDVDLLIQQLASRDPSARLRATKALGELGPAAKGAASALTVVLGDFDGDVRRGAITAIRLVQPDAKPSEALIKAIATDLKSPDANLRLLAARTLGRIGPLAAAAIPDLDALRAEPDPDVRRAVADALSRIAAPPP